MSEISSDIKFQVLHEHYNDTFSNIKESLKLRDRLTLLALLVLTLLVLYTFWPSDAMSAFSQLTAQKIGVAMVIDGRFLGSIIWFALFATVLRYTQVVVNIERQYAYIHLIEKELQKYYNSKIPFTRESTSYLNNYPAFSNWACLLYTTIFPIILSTVVLSKIYSEWGNSMGEISFSLLINTAIALCILISIVLYMCFTHIQQEKEEKKI